MVPPRASARGKGFPSCPHSPRPGGPGRDRKVIGEVRYQDLVLADNRALLAARAAERGES